MDSYAALESVGMPGACSPLSGFKGTTRFSKGQIIMFKKQ
jgi:hypothetical protein